MKKLLNRFICLSIIVFSFFTLFLFANNEDANAWTPKKATEDSKAYVSELCAFQSWYSSDIEEALIEHGFKTDRDNVVCGNYGYYDLNSGCGASVDDIALAMKYTDNPDEAITSLYAEVNYDGSYAPVINKYINGFLSTYYVVGGYKINRDSEKKTSVYVEAQDFNNDAGGAYVYLYYSKDRAAGTPITFIELKIFEDWSTHHEPVNSNYAFVKRLDGEDADFNHGASDSTHIYMQYEFSSMGKHFLSFDVNGVEYFDDNLPYCFDYLPSEFYDVSSFLDENHRLEGWYYDKDFTVPATPLSSVNINYVTAKGPWNSKKYYIKLYANIEHGGGDVTFETNGAKETYEKLVDVKVLPDNFYVPTKEGYLFTGWYYDIELTKKAKPGDEVFSDLTLYAGYVEGKLISKLYLIFSNDKYPLTGEALDEGIMFYPFNLGDNYEECYDIRLGVKFADDNDKAITNVIVLDEKTFDAITDENKIYVDKNNVEYYPVKTVIGGNNSEVVPVNATFGTDMELDLSGTENKCYIYYTRDNKAGNPIKDFKYQGVLPEGYESISSIGDNDTNLQYLSISRYDNLYVGSIFSNSNVWIAVVCGILVILGIVISILVAKKKKKIIVPGILVLLISSIAIILFGSNTTTNAQGFMPKGLVDKGVYVSGLISFQGDDPNDLREAIINKLGPEYIAKNLTVCNSYGYNDFNEGTGVFDDIITLQMTRTNDKSQAITALYAEINEDGSYAPVKIVNMNGYSVEFHVVGGWEVDGSDCEPIEAQDFNADTGLSYVYLYYTKDSRVGRPITDIYLLLEDTWNTCHEKDYNPGRIFVKRLDGEDADFNHGIEDDTHVYVYFQTSPKEIRHNILYSVNGQLRTDPENLYSFGYSPEHLLDISGELEEHYRFEGWYYEKEFINKVIPNTKFQGDGKNVDVIFYAKITHDSGDISFVTNGADEEYEVINNALSIPSNLPIPTKEGCVFCGWFYDELFTKIVKPNDPVVENITLYAGFEDSNYINEICLLFNNDKYDMSTSFISEGNSAYSFNISNNFEDAYKVYLGVDLTKEKSNAVTNVILLDEDSFNSITDENKIYVDDKNIAYYPVMGLVSGDKKDCISIYSTFDENYELVEDGPYKKYYLYYTKDSKAGQPIREFRFTKKNLDGLTKIKTIGIEDSKLKNLGFTRKFNIDVGSAISNASIWVVLSGAAVIVIGIIAVVIIAKKKKVK